MPSSAVLISGIYELEPVLSISVNREIRLRPDQVAAMSPMRHAPCKPVALTVAVGGSETRGFIEQSERFAATCASQGANARFIDFEACDHYTVMRHFESPQGELTRLVVRDLLSI
jgi:arylformamidase